MHGLAALLAEKHFVAVRLENAVLVVARLDQQREQRFVELAREALAAIEKQILDQLLGQRAAALHDVAGDQVGERRAQDRHDVDAVMMLEVAILDGLQAGNEQRRQLFELDDAALLLFGAVQGGDARGIEARVVERGAGIGIGQRADPRCRRASRRCAAAVRDHRHRQRCGARS